MTRLACLAAAGAIVVLQATSTWASDHADPIDNPLMFWRTTPLEGGITDLFVFPTKDKQQLVVILCVRRALTSKPANLERYEYAVHMDLTSKVSHHNSQNNARYGGTVENPNTIAETLSIKYRLKGDGELLQRPEFISSESDIVDVRSDSVDMWGGKDPRQIQKVAEITGKDAENKYGSPASPDPTKVNVWTGIADDPFIFPAFFKTNVVAMVATIPMAKFKPTQMNWIVWATSRKGNRQIDHVGRSLRTQNPRFEILNTLHPKEHVKKIEEANDNPTIERDLFLRLGINGLFGYRDWDKAPDVMLFTREPDINFGEYELQDADGLPMIKSNNSNDGASFPNGRLLTDDVADRLARYGDTLLKELSYVVRPCQNADPPDPSKPAKPECTRSSWPRRTVNDKPFQADFPYLAEPWGRDEARLPMPKLALHKSTVITIGLIALAVVLLWILTAWLLALWIDHKRQRRHYL